MKIFGNFESDFSFELTKLQIFEISQIENFSNFPNLKFIELLSKL